MVVLRCCMRRVRRTTTAMLHRVYTVVRFAPGTSLALCQVLAAFSYIIVIADQRVCYSRLSTPPTQPVSNGPL